MKYSNYDNRQKKSYEDEPATRNRVRARSKSVKSNHRSFDNNFSSSTVPSSSSLKHNNRQHDLHLQKHKPKHTSDTKHSIRSINNGSPRNPKYSFLPLEWWDRADDCKDAKSYHVAKVDSLCDSREQLVLDTTLWKNNIALEPNMFPCKNFFFLSENLSHRLIITSI